MENENIKMSFAPRAAEQITFGDPQYLVSLVDCVAERRSSLQSFPSVELARRSMATYCEKNNVPASEHRLFVAGRYDGVYSEIGQYYEI